MKNDGKTLMCVHPCVHCALRWREEEGVGQRGWRRQEIRGARHKDEIFSKIFDNITNRYTNLNSNVTLAAIASEIYRCVTSCIDRLDRFGCISTRHSHWTSVPFLFFWITGVFNLRKYQNDPQQQFFITSWN